MITTRNLLSFLFAAMTAIGSTQAQDFAAPTENDPVPEGFVLKEEVTDTASKNSDVYKNLIQNIAYYGILNETDTCDMMFKFKFYESDLLSKAYGYYYADDHLIKKQFEEHYDGKIISFKRFFFDYSKNLVGTEYNKFKNGKLNICWQKFFLKDGKRIATETKNAECNDTKEAFLPISLQVIYTNHIDGTEVSILYKKGESLSIEEKKKDGTKKSYRHLASQKDIKKLLADNVSFYKNKFPEADWEWLKK